MNLYVLYFLYLLIIALIKLSKQLPEEDVPMRSVSIASDGTALVAGNHAVRLSSLTSNSH